MRNQHCLGKIVRVGVLVVGILLMLGGNNIPIAHAATINVTSTSGGTGGPSCTLRDAITAANTDTAVGSCPAGSGADTIVLPVSPSTDTIITLTVVDNGTGSETNGLPAITTNITINGSGAIIERSTVRETPLFRIFQISTGGTLTLNNVTIRNGHTPDGTASRPGGYGGGIGNSGTLNITNSTITGNTTGDGAIGSGYNGGIAGGIYNANVLSITNSSISGNRTGTGNLYGGHGGGIASNGMGAVTITDSTISGNTTGNGTNGDAGWGGGIFSDAQITVTNSTISGNTVGNGVATGGRGGGICISTGGMGESSLIITKSTISNNLAPNVGGIFNDGKLTMANVTVSGNQATGGTGGLENGGTANLNNVTFNLNAAIMHAGGLHNTGTITVANTIVANSISLNCTWISPGMPISKGYNLSSDDSCAFNQLSDLNNNAHAHLGALGNYGGPTKTHGLMYGSAAINTGDTGPCTGLNYHCMPTDQRGVTRPQAGRSDIGAFEGWLYPLYLPLIMR